MGTQDNELLNIDVNNNSTENDLEEIFEKHFTDKLPAVTFLYYRNLTPVMPETLRIRSRNESFTLNITNVWLIGFCVYISFH